MPHESGETLRSMAETVAQAMGRYSPGRPAFYALSRAHNALREAAREVDDFAKAYGPRDGSAAP